MSNGPGGFTHSQPEGLGVLLINLGTPEAPTPSALRRYLREFLSDRRVVELPRWRWWPILHLFVLTTRPRRSAALYRRIWWEEGSPLLVIGRRQAQGLQALLRERWGPQVWVRLAMRYGNPSIRQGLRELSSLGCRRVLLFPLYPQYASATTGSSLEVAFRELARWRWVPEVRVVASYHDHPAYVKALANSVRESWQREAPGEKLLFSFHGIPLAAFLAGDPYFCHCQKTARLVAEELELPRDRWEVAFQSKFGRDPWLEPATIELVSQWGRQGLSSLDVLCPGFAADCLETLEEIAMTNREAFLHAGGGRFRYIPALNDRPDHLQALSEIASGHMAGWGEAADVSERERRFREFVAANPFPGAERF
ncbi:ferrochelatase [Thermoanaerobaculum aquaticum]|uniref:Ferrochelatase n=1 Tax=Thermoanaerobaculum aquaticum TaxID=1312852 RepID=A0A062Y0G3_9BACT|nr:ferrochelatase [Thermoanaerobaculum aquaticum]KDA54255.1 ferrochelatase [Thermoanaerobaculum aquaticum]BCW92539.1 MAG: ferrochelatase 2 [Thermoanaerobaculum sp.]